MGERDELRSKGAAIREALFDAEYMESFEGSMEALEKPYFDLASEVVWGRVWAESGLDEMTKLQVNIAVFTVLGHADHLKPYIRAAAERGMAWDRIRDIITQTALYAGFPKGYIAMEAARKVQNSIGSAKTA